MRLYFVPCLTLMTEDYLVCPVCSRGLQVNDAQLRHVRPMSAATASFRAGRLPQAQYMAQAEAVLGAQLGGGPRGPGPCGSSHARYSGTRSASHAWPGQPPLPGLRPWPHAPETSWISHLHQLAQLHDQGVLSDADYAAAKRRILEHDKQPQPPGPASSPAWPPAD